MLLEVRIGPEKWRLKQLFQEVRQKFRLNRSNSHKVPHITIYGRFSAGHEQMTHIKRRIAELGERYDHLPFTIDGYDHKISDAGHVIALKIVPSREFEDFTTELKRELIRIAPRTRIHDQKPTVWFHSTVAYKLPYGKYKKIWDYLNGQENESFFDAIFHLFTKKRPKKNHLLLPASCLRLTMLNESSRIAFEYDFCQKRFLGRNESLSKSELGRTLGIYRRKTGAQLEKPDYEAGEAIHLISDLHLDHSNIIRYCSRPFLFSNVQEMNEVLLNNWNYSVKNSDRVYFLGDISYGRRSRPARFWLPKLNGNIKFICGSHDERVEKSSEKEAIEFGGFKFLLLHDPAKKPADWKDWVIHGHKHNNNIMDYPFINGKNKTINVSAELINYRPVSIKKILSYDLNSIKRLDTINSKPEY